MQVVSVLLANKRGRQQQSEEPWDGEQDEDPFGLLGEAWEPM